MSQTTASSGHGPSSTTTARATATSAIALTTPFAPPPSCADIWTTTSGVVSGAWSNYTTTTFPIVASDTADPRFGKCQPPGWGGAFTFSPAVCPSDWTAYSLGTTYTPATAGSSPSTSNRDVSTAYCCARGFTLGYPAPYMTSALEAQGVTGKACVQSIQATPDGLRFHRAWQIRWEATDTMSLSPTPPALTCPDRMLSSWVPGSSVTERDCDPVQRTDGYNFNSPVMYFLMIGVPIIVVVLVATCCFFCCRHRRVERRKREERAQQEGSVQPAQKD
ncbi:hypothetical protein MAPG_06062 [Magnaporthiopsis poae ATCC 64411]|uniref:Uncharacterized protein n=1 Tax=Magnaporthiopsis poae (strain ATCC 64411 / 73-15) TaxID=644358 RepID=A0A0C4E119_MAGP6|nr:hypothetical protein MAPG_06062 [Magnaporthiopsis poae ATCC 64411]